MEKDMMMLVAFAREEYRRASNLKLGDCGERRELETSSLCVVRPARIHTDTSTGMIHSSTDYTLQVYATCIRTPNNRLDDYYLPAVTLRIVIVCLIVSSSDSIISSKLLNQLLYTIKESMIL